MCFQKARVIAVGEDYNVMTTWQAHPLLCFFFLRFFYESVEAKLNAFVKSFR